MTPDQIRVGQVLAGKGSDADKTRTVEAINEKRREATTRVHRGRVDLGTSTISLAILAQWTSGEVPGHATQPRPGK